MNWRLFSKGRQFSKLFLYEREGQPKFVSPLYLASFSSFGDSDFCGRAIAILRSLKSVIPMNELMPVLLSAYDLSRSLGVGGSSSRNGEWATLAGELSGGIDWQLDSGVYEKDCYRDSSWEPSEFISVFQNTRPPWVVAFDERPESSSLSDFDESFSSAAAFAKGHLRDSMVTLLVHFHEEGGLWEREASGLEAARINNLLAVIVRVVREMGDCFGVIGVAEKELGPGIRSRVRSVNRIAIALDLADIHKPVHVFGISDPQALALYSLAGASIFDGVNWSRYYLDTEDCCMRDKALMSWKEPALGEASTISSQAALLEVSNVLRLQKFTAVLRRLIETGKPHSVREEGWCSFVRSCCEGISVGRK